MEEAKVLSEFLNKYRAGDVLIFIVALAATIFYVYRLIRKYLKEREEKYREQLERDTHLSSALSDVTSMKEEMDTLKNLFEVNMNDIRLQLQTYVNSDNQEKGALHETIDKLNDQVTKERESIRELEKIVGGITTKISILIKSDKTYLKTYIVDAHQKYVERGEEIDMIQMDRIEKIYREYLEYIHDAENDSFTRKLMDDIRKLDAK